MLPLWKIFQNATTMISFPDLYHAVGMNTPVIVSSCPLWLRHHRQSSSLFLTTFYSLVSKTLGSVFRDLIHETLWKKFDYLFQCATWCMAPKSDVSVFVWIQRAIGCRNNFLKHRSKRFEPVTRRSFTAIAKVKLFHRPRRMMQRREYLLSARYIALQLVANLWRQFVAHNFQGNIEAPPPNSIMSLRSADARLLGQSYSADYLSLFGNCTNLTSAASKYTRRIS